MRNKDFKEIRKNMLYFLLETIKSCTAARRVVMRYKIVFLDIDGTIVPHGKTISEPTKHAIQKLRERKIHVVLATGRAPYFSEKVIRESRAESMVFFNGAFVYHEGKEIYQNPIEKRVLEKLHHLTNHHKHPLTYLGNTVFKATDLRHPFVVEAFLRDPWKPQLAPPAFWMDEDIFQVFLHCDTNEEAFYQSKVPELDFRRWSSIGARTCDVNLSSSTKAVGITKLLEKLGIAPDEAVAFGDGLNDIEMLSLVGMGVAMGSARDEVKQAANMVTLSAEEDGVKWGLEKLHLI
jgi:Cof subfamily protein (haloacid dehalogenase superfamily)